MTEERVTHESPAAATEDRLRVHEETDGDLITRWTESAEAVATSIDCTNEAGQVLLSKCMSTADLKTRSAVGQTLAVVGYVAHVAEVTSEDGEVLRKIRAIILLDDGRTLSTMSKPCLRVIGRIAKMRGPGPWTPPAYVTVSEHPLAAGKSYCDMRQIEAPREPSSRKGK